MATLLWKPVGCIDLHVLINDQDTLRHKDSRIAVRSCRSFALSFPSGLSALLICRGSRSRCALLLLCEFERMNGNYIRLPSDWRLVLACCHEARAVPVRPPHPSTRQSQPNVIACLGFGDVGGPSHAAVSHLTPGTAASAAFSARSDISSNPRSVSIDKSLRT